MANFIYILSETIFIFQLGLLYTIQMSDNIKIERHKTFERLNEKARSMEELKLALYALNSISECISITDLNEKILYVNDAFLKTYGYSLSELVGQSITIIRSDKNDLQTISQIHPSTIKQGWRGKLWNKRKDNTEFLIELYTTTARDENGDLVARVGVARDLTEEIKSENILREAQIRFKELFTELKDAVYESNPEGKFIALNPAGMEMFGVSSIDNDELKNLDIGKIFYLDERERNKFKQELEKNGFVKDYEINIRRLNGTVATVHETSLAIKDSSGKIIAYRGILRDITEQKKSEGKLKQLIERLEYINNQLKISEEELKNANASKDKFFSIIAHDLRSPFSSLLSFSEFLVDDIDELPKEDIKSFAEKIHESAKNVFTLLENLLQWSKIQSGKIPYQPSNFNISFKINQIISLLTDNATNKKIHLVNEVSPNVVVFADEDMISSVIQNLLSNAIKFTNESGSVLFRSLIKASSVDISVTDTGVGIKEEDLPKLLRIDVHHTTYGTKDEKGSGLGLIICKEMIERNRGKIHVESKVGVGTTFTFTLPKA
ncbi:MAG: PAS domain-containing sensor histidine kinase [Ignavibacteriales bacterium]|nr:PAS domain-containing sensor histidine kinase [Ignavibacteriales bacterium]